MKRVTTLFGFLMLLALAPPVSAQEVTEEEAYEWVSQLYDEEGLDMSDMDVFYSRASIYETGLDQEIIDENFWLTWVDYHIFFIDERPDMGWTHECSYVFVPTEYADDYELYENTRRLTFNMPLASDLDYNPYDVKDRYSGSNSAGNLYIGGATKSPKQSAHTYALIVSGGVSKNMNHERYWNDCSYLYRVLRNKYLVPKANISILMSDGTDSSADMRKLDGTYASSPLDLDGDGVADIQLAATKANIESEIKRLSSSLTNNDQLLIYVIDHGGYDEERGESFICLWDYEYLYASELSEMLQDFPTPFVNVALGQCNSGGFVPYLEQEGRVIAAACAEDESSWACADIPYDEFVFQWTNALNMRNGFTGATVSADLNSDDKISMYEAATAAIKNDRRAYLESPVYSSKNLSVGEELAVDSIPKMFSLYIRDDANDTGLEPNNVVNFWWGPDVWMRNQNDGFVNQCSEPITLSEDEVDKDIYLYARVHNRGLEDYNPENGMWYVHFYYVDASLGIKPINWLGLVDQDEEDPWGREIEAAKVEAIPKGQDGIVRLKWNATPAIDDFKKQTIHYCILARLVPSRGEVFNKKEAAIEYLSDIRRRNKLAQKNISFIVVGSGDNELPLKIRAVKDEAAPYDIVVKAEEGYESFFDQAELALTLSDEAASNWSGEGVNVKRASSNPNVVRITGDGAMEGVVLDRTDEMTVSCNFLNTSVSMATDTFKINIMQRDIATGKIVGGEGVCIIRTARTDPFEPMIDEKESVGEVELEEANISEAASYSWYDSSGKTIGNGKKIILPAGTSGEITLRAVAEKDGTVAYATTTVENPLRILSASFAASGASLNVKLSGTTTDGAVLRLSSVNGGASTDCAVNGGDSEVSVDTSKLVKGVYVLSLIKDNKILDTRRITK